MYSTCTPPRPSPSTSTWDAARPLRGPPLEAQPLPAQPLGEHVGAQVPLGPAHHHDSGTRGGSRGAGGVLLVLLPLLLEVSNFGQYFDAQ